MTIQVPTDKYEPIGNNNFRGEKVKSAADEGS